METLRFERGSIEYIKVMTDAICDSKLGEEYFAKREKAEACIRQGLLEDEVYVAFLPDNSFAGLLWFVPRGAFHSFPYLHILAVPDRLRGKGIGKSLLSFYERTIREYSSKSFLVVADFNPEAKRLYEKLGYKEVGILPDLYKPGVAECLMMKVL